MSVCESVPKNRKKLSESFVIENADIVTENELLKNASVLIAGERIGEISREDMPSCFKRIDAKGALLIPGFIDLHSDAIEKSIRPRPGGSFPTEISLIELDKQLASCGITSMYHCLCFGESETNDLRTAKVAGEIAGKISELKPHFSVRNNIHARYEVSDIESAPHLEKMLSEGLIQLFSIMDHTPGQGQFTDMKHFKTYYAQAEHLNESQACALAEARIKNRQKIGNMHIEKLCSLCRKLDIPMASHDDDTPQKVDWVKSLGITLSEFPVHLKAAQKATQLGMDVLMGAPNILRGSSLTDNLSGRDAILHNACNIIGSDYSPMSMLHALFACHKNNLGSLPQLVRMLSFNPAKAVGLSHELGAIKEGYIADMVMVNTCSSVAKIMATFVAGKQVFGNGDISISNKR